MDGDALHGPLIDDRRTFLFCFIDDHSRLLVRYRWVPREDVLDAYRAPRGDRLPRLAELGWAGALREVPCRMRMCTPGAGPTSSAGQQNRP